MDNELPLFITHYPLYIKFFWCKPLVITLISEPRKLPFGISAGVLFDAIPHCVVADLPVEVVEHFGVAHRSERGRVEGGAGLGPGPVKR